MTTQQHAQTSARQNISKRATLIFQCHRFCDVSHVTNKMMVSSEVYLSDRSCPPTAEDRCTQSRFPHQCRFQRERRGWTHIHQCLKHKWGKPSFSTSLKSIRDMTCRQAWLEPRDSKIIFMFGLTDENIDL